METENKIKQGLEVILDAMPRYKNGELRITGINKEQSQIIDELDTPDVFKILKAAEVGYQELVDDGKVEYNGALSESQYQIAEKNIDILTTVLEQYSAQIKDRSRDSIGFPILEELEPYLKDLDQYVRKIYPQTYNTKK